MNFAKRFDLLFFICLLVFSWWLFSKSFGYDVQRRTFWVARHQVGDFGLHMSLIRSFSRGENYPPELPFYPGRPLTYHYYSDFFIGMLERIGVRMDIALNEISALCFTVLLFVIYKFHSFLFRDKAVGVFAVLFSILHSNLTFIDFVKSQSLSSSLFHNLWLLPDYIHKGPFDNSLISILLTLNVYLNQRHLVAALMLSLGCIYVVTRKLLNHEILSFRFFVIIGLIIGLSSRLHVLIFMSSVVVVSMLLIQFKQWSRLIPFYIALAIGSFSHIYMIVFQNTHAVSSLWNPGFLSQRPFNIVYFLQYWWVNLGLALIFIPLGVYFSHFSQRKVFWSFFVLFIIANTVQLSYRIDHNHSLINYFIFIANGYIAFALIKLWKKNVLSKIFILISIVVLTASGLIDLMALKNDFRFPVETPTKSAFMEWITQNTSASAIFLARQDLFDPITLAGRKNYFGATYYLEVMGYDIVTRRALATEFFQASSDATLDRIRNNRIGYIAIPKDRTTDFPYFINEVFLHRLPVVYSNADVTLYKL